MRRLFLIGAGEFAREVESWISLDKEFLQQWEIVGFLDHNLNALDKYPSYYSIVGTPDQYDFQPGDAALMCIANPVSKRKIAEAICHKVEFITYLSNHAIVGKYAKIGKGSVICPNTIVSTNATIEDYTTINCGCIIGHDCAVGEYSSIMPHVDLGGHVKIGRNNFLGTKTTVIPSRKIADNITIGAASVVVRNLTKEGTYFGNPASILKY